MAQRIIFNPFTATFDYVATASSDDGTGSEGNKGINSLSVIAPLTKSGLNTDPIIGTDLRSLSELP